MLFLTHSASVAHAPVGTLCVPESGRELVQYGPFEIAAPVFGTQLSSACGACPTVLHFRKATQGDCADSTGVIVAMQTSAAIFVLNEPSSVR